MSLNLRSHVFAGSPLKIPKDEYPLSPKSAFESLKSQLLESIHQSSFHNFRVLPFRKGKPLASSNVEETGPNWHLAWIDFAEWKRDLIKAGVQLDENSFVYLGSSFEDDAVYWGVDVTDQGGLVPESGNSCFVELRTLMVATDWSNEQVMGELAIAGHGRALLEWHNVSRFCGNCGEQTVLIEAGRRKQCTSQICKKRFYPRVDPVVIMLVIDKENDRALLSRQSRFVPRMWSCLAGFIEPGESLEEAVRREIWEETGIDVGEVVYHSSQPWPVGPNSMPCQLMIGFFAYAKSLEINVDKKELEDAQWHSRDDVRKALTFREYNKAQRTAMKKVDGMCKGVEKGQDLRADFNVKTSEGAQMFVPGPFAIAHHLISSWVNQGPYNDVKVQLNQPSGSLSNL